MGSVRRNKAIRINGHDPACPVMIEDPDVKRTFRDSSGEPRHVRFFSDAVRLKSYLRRHPEGLVLAGAGAFFFTEPIPVPAARIRFCEDGSADIRVKDKAELIERQIARMEEISAAAGEHD